MVFAGVHGNGGGYRLEYGGRALLRLQVGNGGRGDRRGYLVQAHHDDLGIQGIGVDVKNRRNHRRDTIHDARKSLLYYAKRLILVLMEKIFTIGFSGKNESGFFDLLNAAGVRRLIDIRLWRAARFVPWAAGASLATKLGDRYCYMPELAPTRELLSDYKDGAIDWAGYEKIFNELLTTRKAEKLFDADAIDGVCFLCSERTADKCHRRLVVEYLSAKFGNVEIIHL